MWITISCARGHFHSLNITLASGHTKIFHWRILFIGDGNSFACWILNSQFFRILKMINFGIPTLMYGIAGLFMTKYTEEVIVDGKSIVIHFWYQENRNSPNWIIFNQLEKLECVKGTLTMFAHSSLPGLFLDCPYTSSYQAVLGLIEPYWALGLNGPYRPYWRILLAWMDLPKNSHFSLYFR